MYVPRIVYEGCSSFQDINREGSCAVNSLFNLTQNYIYLVPNDESFVGEKIQDTTIIEEIAVKKDNSLFVFPGE